MRRQSLIVLGFLALSAFPFLILITPASASVPEGHPTVVASHSGSGSHHTPPPPPVPSGSASSHKK